MTNGWTDIRNADLVLVMGGNAAEAHPCGFKWVTEAMEHRKARLVVVDPRFTRSAAIADYYAPLRVGTDIAFLGGVINYLMSKNKIHRDYVLNYTNASFIVGDKYAFENGLFSGYDEDKRSYDRSAWGFARGDDGFVKVDQTLKDPNCVYQIMKKHFSRYTPEVVEDVCPFDPALPPLMVEATKRAIEEHRAAKAKESWALWTDEIGVFAKEHIARCGRCAEKFRAYVQAQKLTPVQLGAATWDEVKPFDIWGAPTEGAKTGKGKAKPVAAGPQTPADALRAYYTSRFMTHVTAQVFPEAARQFKAAGIPLYAMQGPTPSWSGSSLDWHEFYDHGANTAFVFETSNRDARVWQWESYLADIGRGIAARHQMPMGCLVKPHRGAPAQRMLTVVARGTRVVEWYTYGPDYSKGDSFSQSPELLEQVARAARFLGQAEEYLYGAKLAGQPEVAFVTPRSSEIWGRSGGLNGTAFENAKWVYLALAHAHVPVDILSEQQLAEGKLERYKVLYIPGPNLRRDATSQVRDWVRDGGRLWTDATGLSRDEANQPSPALDDLLGLKDRALESWGSVPAYGATTLAPLVETNPPAHAVFAWSGMSLTARIGREVLKPTTAEVIARFTDNQPAVTQNRFGRGEVMVVGCWSGVSYSARVRRPDFDMRADFDRELRMLIMIPTLHSISGHVRQRDRAQEEELRRSGTLIRRTGPGWAAYRGADSDDPLVEAVALENKGRRFVALINWGYQRKAGETGKGTLQRAESLRVGLSDLGDFKSVRSLVHGPLQYESDRNFAVVPSLAEIDLLILE